jgi:AcrR family transcriptional regulator
MGRPREHDDATRARLLQAAEHLSATQGFEAITVRAVAEEAGTTTRAVYALFGSKQGLEQALHEAMFTRLRDLMQACPRSDDPRQDLLVQALAYRRWAVERPERYAVAIHRFVGQPERPRSEEGVAASRDALDELRQAVRRCRGAGQLRVDLDPEDLVTQLRAVVHGLAELENLGRLEPEPERQWRAALSALFDGYAQAPVAHAAAQAPAALP